MLLIKSIRKKQGKTQTEVAKALNVSVSTYKRIENNENQPRLQTAIALAHYFGLPIEKLFEPCTSISLDVMLPLKATS